LSKCAFKLKEIWLKVTMWKLGERLTKGNDTDSHVLNSTQNVKFQWKTMSYIKQGKQIV